MLRSLVWIGRQLHRHAGFFMGLSLAGLLITPLVQADRILLRGGGQIRGKLLTDPSDPNRLTLIGEAGKTPIFYKKEQILQVYPEKSVLDDYVDLRTKERTIAEEEYQLGLWCEEHKLRDLAENHYEAAVKLDAQYAPAHEKLGHLFLNDRWLNADEQREAQGQVKYRGRWMLPEEKERLEDQAAVAAESQSWVRRVKLLRDAYLSGADARAKDAEKRLLAIREVVAVGPVLRVLGSDANPAVRELGSRVLGLIEGPEASSALVARLLGETDGQVRERIITEAARREPAEILPRLVRSLRSPRAEIINRAAWSLSQLNAKTAVPQLIPALTTTEYRTEQVPVNGGGGGIGASSMSGGGGVGFSNYTGSTYLGITPPVVGPGVVAYGAVGVPYGSGVSLGGGGASMGGSVGGIGVGGGGNGGMMTRIVPIDHPNVEVLAALVKLTGQDYGYNVGMWKQWASSSFRSDPRPTRRVVDP